MALFWTKKLLRYAHFFIINSMKIERKKKEHSEKLFNELVLFYLLNRNSYFFEYEASFLLKVSSRTLRRYIPYKANSLRDLPN